MENKESNKRLTIIGFSISMVLYVATYLIIRNTDIFIDYLVDISVLGLLPLEVMAGILTWFGRHKNVSKGVKAMGWVAFGFLVAETFITFVLFFAAMSVNYRN